MFKNSLENIFPFVHRLYDLSELILVGSDIESWLNILQKTNVEKVHYINQSSMDYRSDSLPKNWEVFSKIFDSEDGETTFYELTNNVLNGTVNTEILAKLWKNLETLNITKREAITLKSFLKKACRPNSSKMLVIDTFDGLSILNDLKSLDIDVLAIRVIIDEGEEFDFVSQTNIEKQFTKWGYKNIAIYEDNHPKIKTAVYTKDVKRQTREYEEKINSVRQNAQKTLTTTVEAKEQELTKIKSDLETKNKEIQVNSEKLQKQTTELENKTKILEENLQQITSAKEASQKELAEIKKQLENKTKELTIVIEEKEQELTKIKSDLETKNKEVQEKTDIDNNLIASKNTLLTSEYLDSLDMQEKVKAIVSQAMHQEDVLESIDVYVLGNALGQEEKFEVCCEFAQQIANKGDKMQGVGFINNAKLFLSQETSIQSEQYKKLINIANTLHLTFAVDLEMEYNANYGIFTENINKRLFEEYKKIRSASNKQQQHGQDLLIDYINENIKDGEGKGKVLVEVGTTRENVPGQGSTLQLASLCKRKGIRFITVDMDAHNTRWANFISKKYDLKIEAITSKGEDFLKHDIDSFDFVFLDAYDFDHGHHSELRQSRYEKYLGSKISEKKAHKMHLKCAKSVVKKLKKDGALCIDDTWQDKNGKWEAKGATAMPYLLNQGWSIIDQRNNAVLIRRKNK